MTLEQNSIGDLITPTPRYISEVDTNLQLRLIDAHSTIVVKGRAR